MRSRRAAWKGRPPSLVALMEMVLVTLQDGKPVPNVYRTLSA